jgi:hypothetical protein
MFQSNSLRRKPVGRPRKQPSEKKRGKSIALHPVTVKKMEAIRQVHEDYGYYPPTDSWIAEKGLNYYFEAETKRHPELKAKFDEIDASQLQSSKLLTPIPKPSATHSEKISHGSSPPAHRRPSSTGGQSCQ